MSRLNSSAVIAGRPTKDGTTISTSIRKIDNGWIESRYRYNDKTGESQSSEKFSAEAPFGASGSGGVGNEGLSDVKTYLGRDV